MGYTEFYTFLIPLYGLSIGMSASQIGMLVGGRSLLARIIHEALEAAVLQRDRRAVFRGVGDAVVGV